MLEQDGSVCVCALNTSTTISVSEQKHLASRRQAPASNPAESVTIVYISCDIYIYCSVVLCLPSRDTETGIVDDADTTG